MTVLDALRVRLAEFETVGERAAEAAAITVANKLRADVNAGRRGAQKRRKVERAMRKASGDPRRVKMGRTGSGVKIAVEAIGSTAIVTASSQVHHVAREQAEPEAWMGLFGDAVRSAAQPGGKGLKR